MQIDVVISTCNNAETKNYSLHYTIRSILSQSLQPRRIFVVENHSIDSLTRQIEEEFGSLVSVIDGTQKPNNISFARNLGAKAGNSELILFIDDDVVLGRNHFLELVASRMRYLDFSCGAYRYWTRTDWHTYLHKSFPITHIQNILRSKSYLPRSIERFTGSPSYHEFSFIGHFGAVKRDVFNKIGGFDEDFIQWSYQDTDLMMRLSVNDYQYNLLYNDHITVYHLAHTVDKSRFLETNRDIFLNKQKKMGIKFHLNHFFGVFDDDSYPIWSQ